MSKTFQNDRLVHNAYRLELSGECIRTVRFFTVLILLKATMRFEEGYGQSSPLAFHAYANLHPSYQD